MDDWKKHFAGLPQGAAGNCPGLETLSTWAKAPLPREAIAHLADCPRCREEIVEARRRLSEKPVTARIPARRVNYGWIAAAAALLIALILYVAFSGETPAPVVVQPTPKVRPVPPLPEPSKPLPPPEVAPKTQEKPPAPAPVPEKPPAPPAPAPVEKPVIAKPTPEPVKPAPAPVPEKPAPAPLTRAKLKGSLLGLAGTPSTQIDSDVWQPLRSGQGRDFNGTVAIKADVAATKLRVGAHTLYVQRGSELSFTMEEGRTGVKLGRGEAFFDVTPGKDPFEVETPQGTTMVKGTRFLVALANNETEVVVQRGAVQFNAIALSAGERSTGGPAQKADLAKRLAWVRALEESIVVRGDQMALQGGMIVWPDRTIGIKDPLKPGQEAAAELRLKHKQPAPYAVWIRVLWPHGVPPAMTLSVGDLSWSSKHLPSNPKLQWARAGNVEFSDEQVRIRLVDTQPGMKIEQILITTDPEYTPEGK